MEKENMKTTFKSLTMAAAVSLCAMPALAGEKVAIGVPSWTGAQAIAHLLGAVVEMRIGGEVEYVPGNNATIFQAMDQGKGDIDVHPDVWLPNQESFTKKYVDEAGTVTLSSNPYEGNQGFCVSQDFGKANNITDIADLGRPDVAALMDSDGNGKGEMWIGAPGWASANVNEVKTRDYGLMDFIEPIRAEESVKTARIKDSIAKGEGYAFYCYKPHAVWYMFDVMMLSEPTFDPAKYVMVQPSDDPDWFEKSSVATKDALKNVQIAWSNSLEGRSPAIAEFFANFGLTADDVSSFAYEISGKGRDPAEVAREWVEANPERVDAWLGL
jgi:glycine betaine/proline transport system substrate-binding protein